MAAQICFGSSVTVIYLVLSLMLPPCWLLALRLAGGYDIRIIGASRREFRKVLRAGAGLAVAIVTCSYALNMPVSRGYLAIALFSATLFDGLARYAMRRRLHRGAGV